MYTIDYTPYKLKDWIDIDKLIFDFLCENPNAISIIEQNLEKICCE